MCIFIYTSQYGLFQSEVVLVFTWVSGFIPPLKQSGLSSVKYLLQGLYSNVKYFFQGIQNVLKEWKVSEYKLASFKIKKSKNIF